MSTNNRQVWHENHWSSLTSFRDINHVQWLSCPTCIRLEIVNSTPAVSVRDIFPSHFLPLSRPQITGYRAFISITAQIKDDANGIMHFNTLTSHIYLTMALQPSRIAVRITCICWKQTMFWIFRRATFCAKHPAILLHFFAWLILLVGPIGNANRISRSAKLVKPIGTLHFYFSHGWFYWQGQ